MKTLQFCGDVWMPAGTSPRLPSWLTRGLVFNLEGPVTTHDEAAAGKICLRTDPAAMRTAFSEGRPAAACLANNHVLDYGTIGFSDTCEYLRELGIPYFGAGTRANRCNNPLLLPVDGTIVGLMAYVCPSTHPILASDDQLGVAPIRIEDIRADVKTARQRGATRFVVCLHWGTEELELPKPSDVEMAKQILDLGVDLVVGHHTHCRQPIYRAASHAVFFGLGNAIFPDLDQHTDGSSVAWTRQRWWNRRSILAVFAPRTGIVTWSALEQHPETLEVKLSSHRDQIAWGALPANQDNRSYARRYAWASRWSTMRLALSRFVARPKLPSFRTIKHLFHSVLKGS